MENKIKKSKIEKNLEKYTNINNLKEQNNNKPETVKTRKDAKKAKSLALYLQYCGLQALLDMYHGNRLDVFNFLNKAGNIPFSTWEAYPVYLSRLLVLSEKTSVFRNLFTNSFGGVFKTTGFISDDIELTV